MGFPSVPILGGADYQIDNSLVCNDDDTAYLTQTPSAGNQKTWTMSLWLKRGNFGNSPNIYSCYSSSTNRGYCRFTSANTLQLLAYQGGAVALNVTTTRVFRDPSAWYHIVIVVDTTEAAANDRYKLYVNGVEETSLTRSTTPVLNDDLAYSGAIAHYIGLQQSGIEPFDGQISEVYFIDGQALTPSDFGEFDALIPNWWKPKAYAGTYGTNGFILQFKDDTSTTTLGYDTSGNANHWTLNNMAVTDQTTDTPTDNFCVLNPLYAALTATIEDTIRATCPAGGTAGIGGTFPMSSGKWYWEVTHVSGLASAVIGIVTDGYDATDYPGQTTEGWSYYANNGDTLHNAGSASYGNSYTDGDVIGIAYDADNGDLFFYKNNTIQNSGTAAFTGLTGTMYPAIGNASGVGADEFSCDFGQKGFTYTPPTGFKALSTANLPEPTIKYPPDYFNPVLWTGDSSNPRSIDVGLDLLNEGGLSWIKPRNLAYGHLLFNTERGAGKSSQSNSTAAEVTNETSGYISAFESTGFEVDAGSIADDYVNDSAYTYASWNWLKSVVAGFDIVSFVGNATNRTIAHDLGVAPDMMILDNLDAVQNWPVYHSANTAAPETDTLYLNLTNVTFDSAIYWNDTAPTSSVFTVGTDASVNGNTHEMIAYLIAEVEGYSKLGSYTGNGNADGTFINCSFLSRWVLIKRTDVAASWIIWDTARSTFNLMDDDLYPDLNIAEYVSPTDNLDMVSNGFKLRATGTGINASGGTYVYYAIAESPFKYANAR